MLTVFFADLGQFEEALNVFDSDLVPLLKKSITYFHCVDLSSLLWRLNVSYKINVKICLKIE